MSKSPLITFKTFTKKIIKQKGKVINFGDRQCDTITHWERRVWAQTRIPADNKSLTLFFEVNYRRFQQRGWKSWTRNHVIKLIIQLLLLLGRTWFIRLSHIQIHFLKQIKSIRLSLSLSLLVLANKTWIVLSIRAKRRKCHDIYWNWNTWRLQHVYHLGQEFFLVSRNNVTFAHSK